MANVKSRARKSAPIKSKAPKSTPKKQPDKPKTTLTGKIKKKAKNNKSQKNEHIVMKRPSTRKVLTTEEKVQYVLENGNKLKKNFVSIKSIITKRKPESYPKPTFYTKNYDPERPLISKSGRLKQKNKHNLDVLDAILKSELMIDDSGNSTKKSNNVPALITLPLQKNNNNDDDAISDQNDSLEDFSDGSDDDYLMSEEDSESDTSENFDSTMETDVTEQVETVTEEVETDVTEVNKTKNNKEKKKKQKLCITLKNGVILRIRTFECDTCKRSFSRKWLLDRHMQVHLGIKKHTCPRCSQEFRARYTMQLHLETQHKDTEELFVCKYCNKSFLVKESLDMHLNTHLNVANSFRCIYCNKLFKHNILLLHHEQQHLVDGFYKCTLCDMNYRCRQRLYAHVKSHLKIKDYVCHYCGKGFLRQGTLSRHLDISHGGQRIVCPICKKNLKGHLSEHMRTHDKKLKPHKCPDCGQRFIQSTQMNVHRRSHTGARPYACRICTRAFSHSNALMLHIRRHTGEKPFLCLMCPMSFSQLPHMKAHMRKIHGKNDPYKCSKCDIFFKLKAQLDSHEKICSVGTTETVGGKKKKSKNNDETEVESSMSLSRMRFLLALLLTMVASADRLKILGFNKRLIDDLLIESLEAMDQTPCKDDTLSPLKRLRMNIEILMASTVPKTQMETFKRENQTTEDILELLTNEPDKTENRQEFEM